MTTLSFAQHVPDPNKGNIVYTKQGIMDGNNVQTIFYNHGEIAHWPDHPSGEWPKGSGHEYLAGTAFIVQAKAIDEFGSPIHPLETNYREFNRKDPVSKIPWGWEPLPGYSNPTQTEPAMSNKPTTWPAHWPNKTNDWDGQWNGYFGKGVRSRLTETYFVMDDDADRGYPNFRCDSSDSTRGGLGIEVSMRALQWSAPEASDMLFVQHEIVNEGTTNYDSAYVGWFMDPSIGGNGDEADDIGGFLPSVNVLFARDGDGKGQPGNWTPVGVVGYVMLATPDNRGMTGASIFPLHTYELIYDEQNWQIMKSRTFPTVNVSDVNLGAFVSSGPFALAPRENKILISAFIFADDSVQLIQKVNFARRFYESGFNDSLLTSVSQTIVPPEHFELYQNYPNPFNPTTIIRYEIPTKTHVSLIVYNLLGQEVTTLVSKEQTSGLHKVQFDGAGLTSGIYFYRVVAGYFTETKKLILLR